MEIDDDHHDELTESVLLATAIDSDNEQELTTYKQAVTGPHADKWVEGIKAELDALHSNNTWSVVPIPAGRKIVGSKWIFKLKHDADGVVNRHKARLVAQGFTQQPGLDFDEIFAPVVRYDSLRILIALTAHFRWRPQQLDIKAAFLYGVLQEEIYMQLPEGSSEEGKCAKLNKCIYGLKQSPREWYYRLVAFLTPFGFVVSSFDPCVLIYHQNGIIFFLAVYVDDISLFGSTGPFMDHVKNLLKGEFKVTDMGDLHWLLGIRIEYDNDAIRLSQTAYIDTILKRFGLENANPVSYPLDRIHDLSKDSGNNSEGVDIKAYQQIIGSLMYTVTGTRPDLTYTVNRLSQFLSKPTKRHMGAAKHVLRYLKGTRSLKLTYPLGKPLILQGFTDSDYAGCPDTRRSTSGYVFKLADCTIAWRSRKQRSVATSSTEAEYMALSLAVKQYL